MKINKNYLIKSQYKNSTNLEKRINIHKLFSTNKYPWHRWVFDKIKLPAKSRILELGGGIGLLWSENIRRIPANWQIVVSDFSPGMLKQAKNNLTGIKQMKFKIVDAQLIPFPNNTFDAVIANHMLYHVPNLTQALSEIKRVLKPKGTFCATTNGRFHLKELKAMEKKFNLKPNHDFRISNFNLRNGKAILAKWFPKIKLRRHQDALLVTKIKPLVNYLQSYTQPITDEKLKAIKKYLAQEIKLKGSIPITKDSGIFIANK